MVDVPPSTHAVLNVWLGRLICGMGLGRGDGIGTSSPSEFWFLELKTGTLGAMGLGAK